MSLGPATLRAASMASAHLYPDNIRSRAFSDILPDTVPDILPAPLSTLGTAGILGGDFWEEVEFGRRQLGSAFPDIPPESEAPPAALSPSIPLLDDFWYQVENGRRQLDSAFPNILPETEDLEPVTASLLPDDFWEQVENGRRQLDSAPPDVPPETDEPPATLSPSVPLLDDFWYQVVNAKRRPDSESPEPDTLPETEDLPVPPVVRPPTAIPLSKDFWEKVANARRQVGSGDDSGIPLLNSFWDEVEFARRQLGSFHLPNVIENALSERRVRGFEDLKIARQLGSFNLPSLIDSTLNVRQIESQSKATRSTGIDDSFLRVLTEILGKQSEFVREIAKRLADSPVYSMD